MNQTEDQGIGRKMVSGTLWMVSMRWTIRLIGLINTAIIARLLIPTDFGLIALAMVAVDLIITITDGDIEMALVRSATADPEFQRTGWTLKILAGIATCATIMAIAPLVAGHFGDQRIVTILEIASLRPLILGFENIAVVEFRRGLRFATEFRYLVAQRLVTFVIGLSLVLAFRDYLALAWSMPASALVTVALSFIVAPGRPRLGLKHWREFWRFSRWQMIFNSTRLVGERCDQIIIGRLGTLDDTGVYVVGFDLAMMPTREIMLPAGRALMPAYAKIAHDPKELAASFHTVLGFAAIIACATGVGISSIAENAVFLVLGDQWGRAVPFVRWLGIFGALEGMWLMLDPFLIATRHERALAIANLAFAAITVPAVAVAARLIGIEAIPFARIAVMTVVLGGVFLRLLSWEWISPSSMARALWRPMAAALAMAVAIHLLQRAGIPARPLAMAADMAVGGSTYLAVLFALWHLSGRPDGAERDLTGLTLARLTRNRAGLR